MSKIGFVYILINEYMPGVYKVGCTERSPHERAAELSAPTGVPAPFEVICYIECDNFQAVEKKFHSWLSKFRISPDREFFKDGLEYAIRMLYWFPGRLSFTAPTTEPLSDYEALGDYLEYSDDCFCLRHTIDPYAKTPKDPKVDASVVAVVAAATSAASVAQEVERATRREL